MNTPSVVSGQVPAYIQANKRRLNLNANAQANIQSSFAVLKYKGQQWSLAYKGETFLLQESPGTDRSGNPLPMSPVPHLDVVICGVTEIISKVWYREQYVDGSDAAPDCFSVNGQYPDAASRDKQNDNCPLCQWNRFGTAAVGRGKACRDYRRIAVVPSGDERSEEYGGPMMLRIPPTSLNNFDRYARELAKHGADVSEVVTRLSFQRGMSYPIIEFNAVAWVEEEAYAIVIEHAESEQVRRMLEDEVVEVTATASTTSPIPSPLAQLPPRPQRSQPMQQAQQEIERRRAAKQASTQANAANTQSGNGQAVEAQPDEAVGIEEPAPTAAAKQSPFRKAQAQAQPQAQPTAQAALHPPAAQAPSKANSRSKPASQGPVPPQAQVIKGVPDDMASVIDGMLGDDSDE